MRLLIVCPFFPWPPDTGIRIQQSGLIQLAARQHSVYLFSLVQSEEERKHKTRIAPYCERVLAIQPVYQLPGRLDGRRQWKDALWSLVRRDPRHFYGPPSPNVVVALRQKVYEWQPDLIWVNTLYMTNYLWPLWEELRAIPKVLVEHNIETSIQRQQVEVATSWSRRIRAWGYWLPFGRFEAQMAEKFNWVVTVSDVDRERLLDLAPRLNPEQVFVLPNGIDVTAYDGEWGTPQPNTLIFPGALTYNANYDAMEFFLHHIFPLVRAENPQVTLRITGRYDGVPVERLSPGNGVELTGYLDDVRPAIAQSWACVVPLRVGGGTRLKILEAMALGTPVVATSKGAEGLRVTDGENILIADEPADFTQAVMRLLGDAALRAKLAANGRRLVAERYSWETIGARLEQLLDRVAAYGTQKMDTL